MKKLEDVIIKFIQIFIVVLVIAVLAFATLFLPAIIGIIWLYAITFPFGVAGLLTILIVVDWDELANY